MSELLALLGRAWPNLLVYPGGLFAFALVWVLGMLQGSGNREQGTGNREQGTGNREGKRADGGWRTEDEGRRTDDGEDLEIRRPGDQEASSEQYATQHLKRNTQDGASNPDPRSLTPDPWHITAIAAPWLALALLPLPEARSFGRPVDAIMLLALLDWPLLVTIASEVRAADTWRNGARRIAALLNGYPPLILALLMLALSRSFELAVFARPPAEDARLELAVLQWLGAATLVLALPPILGIGAFSANNHRKDRKDRKEDSVSNWINSLATFARFAVEQNEPGFSNFALHIGLRLRTIGLTLLAALPWFPLLGDWPWLLPVPPLLIALLLWAYHCGAVGQPMRRWGYVMLGLSGLQLVALLVAAGLALRERLI
jgi:hypothetical protein